MIPTWEYQPTTPAAGGGDSSSRTLSEVLRFVKQPLPVIQPVS
jgi:hypothetical protein